MRDALGALADFHVVDASAQVCLSAPAGLIDVDRGSA